MGQDVLVFSDFSMFCRSVPKGVQICDVTLVWLIQVTSQHAPATSRPRGTMSHFRNS